jgi:hypothetical protein
MGDRPLSDVDHILSESRKSFNHMTPPALSLMADRRRLHLSGNAHDVGSVIERVRFLATRASLLL